MSHVWCHHILCQAWHSKLLLTAAEASNEIHTPWIFKNVLFYLKTFFLRKRVFCPSGKGSLSRRRNPPTPITLIYSSSVKICQTTPSKLALFTVMYDVIILCQACHGKLLLAAAKTSRRVRDIFYFFHKIFSPQKLKSIYHHSWMNWAQSRWIKLSIWWTLKV